MTTAETVVTLKLRGGNRELFAARDPEVLAEGPAGTGKTRSWLELINLLCHTYRPLRVLMLRKTQVSMATSCIAEFKQHVLHDGDGVSFFGGSKSEPAAFRYPNGSIVAVGGMDNAEKVLSSFWDFIYINEATELTLDEFEVLTTRLRASDPDHEPVNAEGQPFKFRRIAMDCNPTYSSHWLMQRTDSGRTRLIRSQLQDNPAYYNDDGTPTEAGLDYISKLDRLTGLRYERFRLGKRVGVQDAIYPFFNRDIHVRPLEPGLYFTTTIVGVDYGTKHECAVVALSIDQYRRRWVREVWAEADTDQGVSLTRVIGQFKEKYKTKRGRTDPNQAFLAGRMGFGVANGAGGSRLHRIDLMEPLFYTFPGGRVPSFQEEIDMKAPQGPFQEPDSPGIFLVAGAPGIDKMADEIEAYHYVWTETAKGKTKDVYRVDENTIAGLEYANEEFMEGAVPDDEPPALVSAAPASRLAASAPRRLGSWN